MTTDNTQDYTQPVAYAADGRPLYAHPPQQASAPAPHELRTEESSHVTAAYQPSTGHGFDASTRVQRSNEPGVTHVTRPIEPALQHVSDDLMQKHQKSKLMFPTLNLSKGEYVIMVVHRHPIGLAIPIGITALAIILLLLLAIIYPFYLADMTAAIRARLPSYDAILLIASLLGIMIALFGYIAVWVYQKNRFILTNESVIQEIQTALFMKHEQTVSLGSIEDASFKQTHFLQVFLNYGTIRLSTEGEETTYRFQFVANPKQQVATLNDAIEDFKNGRPVED